MPVTFPLALPVVSGPFEVRWAPLAAVMRARQDIALGNYAGAHEGKNWVIEVSLPPMDYEDALVWQAWFLKLNGAQGTFLFRDFAYVIAGAASGTGLVNGAAQEGNQFNTDGWTPSVAGLFRAGDWIALDNLLYKILFDVDSNVSGQATLIVWPSLNGTVEDDTVVQYGEAAQGLFHLHELPSFALDAEHMMQGVAFTAEQEKTGAIYELPL